MSPLTVRRACVVLVAFAAACTRGGERDGDDKGSLVSVPTDPVSTTLAIASVPFETVNILKEWKRIEQDKPMPWIAPGKRVEAYVKDQLPNAFDLDTEEYRWHVGDDMVYPYYKYNSALSDFIVKEPISLAWEFSGESIMRPLLPLRVLMPDYDFYLVSIEPMAVVMVPTGKHRRAKRAPYKRGDLTESGAVPNESIKYSTRVPAPKGRQLLWFSPDLKVKVEPLPFDQMLAVGRLRLTCTQTAGTAECQRTAP